MTRTLNFQTVSASQKYIYLGRRLRKIRIKGHSETVKKVCADVKSSWAKCQIYVNGHLVLSIQWQFFPKTSQNMAIYVWQKERPSASTHPENCSHKQTVNWMDSSAEWRYLSIYWFVCIIQSLDRRLLPLLLPFLVSIHTSCSDW